MLQLVGLPASHRWIQGSLRFPVLLVLVTNGAIPPELSTLHSIAHLLGCPIPHLKHLRDSETVFDGITVRQPGPRHYETRLCTAQGCDRGLVGSARQIACLLPFTCPNFALHKWSADMNLLHRIFIDSTLFQPEASCDPGLPTVRTSTRQQ